MTLRLGVLTGERCQRFPQDEVARERCAWIPRIVRSGTIAVATRNEQHRNSRAMRGDETASGGRRG